MIKRLDNPPNPYQSRFVEYLEPPPRVGVEVYEEHARSILSENDSPDLPFRWSVNPYRGCQHACAYCYARPYHEYLELGAGTDFETRLFVKVNAPELLHEALSSRRWTGEMLNFSGVTDCYQPLEAVWHITRRMLEVCLALGNPVAIVTKSYLIVRDAELLAELNRVAGAEVYMSIPFADDGTARLIEPAAPSPSRRFDAMSRLHDAGVPVNVLIAPVIPGLNDSDIPTLLKESAARGPRRAAHVALRLPGSVADVFLSRLREAMPERAQRVENRLREIRGGLLSTPAFGRRMTGAGTYWDSVTQLFEIHRALHGLTRPRAGRPLATMPRRAQPETVQLNLPF